MAGSVFIIMNHGFISRIDELMSHDELLVMNVLINQKFIIWFNFALDI